MNPAALGLRGLLLGRPRNLAAIALSAACLAALNLCVAMRGALPLPAAGAACIAYATIAAAVAATMAIGVVERRGEVATLRALGMRPGAVCAMFVAEAIGMAVCAAVAGMVASGLAAWVLNRSGLSWSARMPVELEVGAMAMAAAAGVAVALLAALPAAIGAARADVAAGLSGWGSGREA